jgi:hypothetical protein
MGGSAPLSAVLAGTAIAAGAAAEPSVPAPAAGVILRWSAPAECPTGDQVLDDARSLGAKRSAPAPAGTASSLGAQPSSGRPVEVEGMVERIAADRWALTLKVGAAQRRIEAASCAQIARTGALFVALMIDPTLDEASIGESAREATSDAGPTAPSAPSAPPAPPTAPPPSGKRAVSVLTAVGVMVDVGTLPHVEPLGALEVGIRYRRFEVTVQGSAGLSQTKMLDGGAGARLRPQSAMLVPCFAVLVLERLRLGPCARSELGWIHAEGIDVAQPRSSDAVWLSFGGEISAWWVLGANVEARLGVGALAPAVRPTFEIAGAGRVFEPGVALRASTAAVMRF